MKLECYKVVLWLSGYGGLNGDLQKEYLFEISLDYLGGT